MSASAGEPRTRRIDRRGCRVYPRECGGTRASVFPTPCVRGLSPRVRGNPGSEGRGGVPAGSIPASAGEPRKRGPRRRSRRVYPRECGGTLLGRLGIINNLGLSPRVRGNHGLRRAFDQPRGSIPRVRGNPVLGRSLRGCGGSIPASAGEPAPARPTTRQARVYPRECGGTTDGVAPLSSVEGLSPRVRGNPAGTTTLTGIDGSIPPRVRGNQIPPVPGAAIGGSIPASAGEPRPERVVEAALQVYPRECGGTGTPASASVVWPGLSTRVRGNRNARIRIRRMAGSIPASAGEPRHVGARLDSGRVYPRECGGTHFIHQL